MYLKKELQLFSFQKFNAKDTIGAIEPARGHFAYNGPILKGNTWGDLNKLISRLSRGVSCKFMCVKTALY